MELRRISFYLLATVAVSVSVFPDKVMAQISSDGTLSTTVSTDDAINFLIENGDISGNNLFHSFSEFSIPNLGSAYFNNATDITNIFSRVTGGNISDIQGLIQANGTANLFLINPAGIIFGENASLDVGGSFFATTAESVVFGDGIEFSATQPQEAPLLTINITPGLQMGANPSSINVSGSNLAVNSGQTLALVGGDITITNGNLTTEQGRVELGSVNQSGLVSLTSTSDGFTLGYEGIENFGEISFFQSSSIDVSGEGAGNINLQGRAINILDDSFLQANTSGTQNGGSIVIKASESVEFFDTDTTDTAFINGVYADVLEGATGKGTDITIETNLLRFANESGIYINSYSTGDTGSFTLKATDLVMSEFSFIGISLYDAGNGGDINVEVEQLELRDASQIGSGVFGAGNGSDVTLKATSIEASGETADGNFTSLIVSVVIPGGTGDAGDISVEAENIRLREGAQIFAGTFGEGNAGDIDVKANSIELIGESPTFGFSSSILASSSQATPDVTVNAGQGDALGDSGNVNIETETLSVVDGATISSQTSGFGDAANIIIQATEVEVIGAFSRIISDSFSDTGGSGGNIELNVERLSIRDGGEISAGTFGLLGDAGNIEIQATEVEVRGTSTDGTRISNINARSTNDSAAGSVTITADDLTIADLATITVSATGLGDAGNLTVNAGNIFLDTQGSLQGEVAAGNQGNINLNSQLLLLRNNSNITTNAGEQANGGNIDIATVNLVALEDSDITANAVFGQGGNIIINAQGLFLSLDSDITASSEFGIDGIVEINTPDEENKLAIAELPANLTDASQQIVGNCSWTRDNTFYVVGRRGIAKTPQEHIEIYQMWSDIRDLSEFESTTVIRESSPRQENTIVEANAMIINEDGKVEFVAVVPSNNQNLGQVASSCSGEVGS